MESTTILLRRCACRYDCLYAIRGSQSCLAAKHGKNTMVMDEMAPQSDAGQAPVVLIVDDEETARTLLRLILVRAGLNVLEAENGQSALRMARESTPDLVLLDVMMPGLDGFEVCASLKANAATADLPVIMLSARTDHDSVQRGLEVGALRYLTKPISAAALREEVQKVLAN